MVDLRQRMKAFWVNIKAVALAYNVHEKKE